MKTKTLLIAGAVALGVFYVLKKRAEGDAVGWWTTLEGIKPGTQQAALLAQQDAAFYQPLMGYSTSAF